MIAAHTQHSPRLRQVLDVARLGLSQLTLGSCSVPSRESHGNVCWLTPHLEVWEARRLVCSQETERS